MPPARPGVREIADGIFLYTTRVANITAAGGPMFVYEVSATGLLCTLLSRAFVCGSVYPLEWCVL